MVTLTPFHSVLDRMVSLSRALDSAPAYQGSVGDSNGTSARTVWFPAMDSHETDNAFVITLDVPGVRQENVEISFEKNTLTIKGNRDTAVLPSEKGEFRQFSWERASGSFARAIRLPEYVDGEKIEATCDNGVLTVMVPKSAAALPRKISIRAA